MPSRSRRWTTETACSRARQTFRDEPKAESRGGPSGERRSVGPDPPRADGSPAAASGAGGAPAPAGRLAGLPARPFALTFTARQPRAGRPSPAPARHPSSARTRARSVPPRSTSALHLSQRPNVLAGQPDERLLEAEPLLLHLGDQPAVLGHDRRKRPPVVRARRDAHAQPTALAGRDLDLLDE